MFEPSWSHQNKQGENKMKKPSVDGIRAGAYLGAFINLAFSVPLSVIFFTMIGILFVAECMHMFWYED
jgi:F0F1-type ATP synthase assembly protein I